MISACQLYGTVVRFSTNEVSDFGETGGRACLLRTSRFPLPGLTLIDFEVW